MQIPCLVLYSGSIILAQNVFYMYPDQYSVLRTHSRTVRSGACEKMPEPTWQRLFFSRSGETPCLGDNILLCTYGDDECNDRIYFSTGYSSEPRLCRYKRQDRVSMSGRMQSRTLLEVFPNDITVSGHLRLCAAQGCKMDGIGRSTCQWRASNTMRGGIDSNSRGLLGPILRSNSYYGGHQPYAS